MVADPGPAPAGEAERRLELRAAGEQRPRGRDRQLDARRDVAARAAQHERPRARCRPPRRARASRPCASRSGGRGRGSRRRCARAAAGVGVAERDRLVGDVAARQHERLDAELCEVGEQQMMQRRVRQHHAELGHARGDRTGDPRAAAARRQHDRPRARDEQRPLGRRRARPAPRPSPRRAPSARTACPRAACALRSSRTASSLAAAQARW